MQTDVMQADVVQAQARARNDRTRGSCAGAVGEKEVRASIAGVELRW